MKVEELINLAFQTATGKQRTLEVGGLKYNRMLAIANMAAAQWEAEPGVTWGSLCDVVDIGNFTAGNAKYRLPNSVRRVDMRRNIYLEKDGISHMFEYLTPSQLQGRNPGVAVFGWNLQFYTPLDSFDGWRIKVPAVLRVKKMENPDDVVQVDDPNWLVYMVAAEYVRNSRTKQNQYASLIALARNAMEGMKANNFQVGASEVAREDLDIW